MLWPVLGSYILMAAGMALCLYLFASLKRELARERKERCRERSALTAEMEALGQRLDGARLALESQAAAQMARPGSPINVTRRSQALRLAKRGDRPAQIASALGLSETEVKLLLKLQRAFVAANSQRVNAGEQDAKERPEAAAV